MNDGKGPHKNGNGTWEWIRANIIILVSLVSLGIWLGTLTAEVNSNTAAVTTINKKLERILCLLGETSNCINGRATRNRPE